MAEDIENQVDETENEEQGEQGQQGGGRTFTQEEVNALINSRFAKLMKGMPSKEELTAFRSWKQTHANDEATLQELTGERDTAQSELEMAKRENHLLKQGIPAEDVDYYVYKISKMVDDDTSFEEATKKFLKENKRSFVRMDTGARLSGGGKGQSANETMNDLLRNARR